MSWTPFNTQTSPLLSELESRLSALEAALTTILDGTFIKWTSSVAGDGTLQETADLKPVNVTPISAPYASRVNMTSATPASIALAASLAPGKYLVFGAVKFTMGAGTACTVSGLAAAVNSANNALPSDRTLYGIKPLGGGAATLPVDDTVTIPPQILDLTGNTGNQNWYLIAEAIFSGGTAVPQAYGFVNFWLLPS